MESPASGPGELWELLEQYRAELVKQAQAIVGNREDAEDVVQETFLKASRNIKKIPDSRIGYWLRTINRRNAVDRWR